MQLTAHLLPWAMARECSRQFLALIVVTIGTRIIAVIAISLAALAADTDSVGSCVVVGRLVSVSFALGLTMLGKDKRGVVPPGQ
jgi:hypothetical protein